MHTNPALTEQRAARVLHERIAPAVHAASVPLALTAWRAPGEPVPFGEAATQDYEPIHPGDPWGPPWGTTWIHATGVVPDGWRDRDGHRIELVVDLGFTDSQPGFQAEGLLRRADGSAIKAISPRNRAADWEGEPDAIDVYIEAASNPDVAGGFEFAPTPLGYRETAGQDPLYRLRRVDVALRDLTVWELVQDLTVLLELAEDLPADSTRRARIDVALERAVDRVDPRNVSGTAAAARAELAGALASPAAASAHHVIAVGHAHIDSAWLWPVRETVRKCVRTFSSVLDLMDSDPAFVFACSSAQQYAWVKEDQPELYERIRRRVAEGRFIPVGGMWLEADTNMPGSEALARQMIEGKSFFIEEFGVETRDVWLPDSFGYTGSLPQIIRAAGSRWFLSQKLSWNDTDRMPHHTFAWEGIDGSLRRLGTDYVDLYQAHRYDYETPLEETMQAFADVVRSGKALYIGVSEWTADQIRAGQELAAQMGFRLVSNQPQYSALWRVIEERVVPVSTELGMGQIVWSPMAEGVLSGKYLPGRQPPAGSRATDDKGGKDMIAVDIFRLADGKIVGHWDVMQEEVPTTQAVNGNPMFPVR